MEEKSRGGRGEASGDRGRAREREGGGGEEVRGDSGAITEEARRWEEEARRWQEESRRWGEEAAGQLIAKEGEWGQAKEYYEGVITVLSEKVQGIEGGIYKGGSTEPE